LLQEKYKKIFPGLFDARSAYIDLHTGNIKPGELDKIDQMTMTLGN